MIKLVIAEDITILRDSLKYTIEQDEEIKVCGMAGNGMEALELCEQKNPDIVIMDIKMPLCDGVEATRLIKERFPHIKVVVLTTFKDDENVYRALKNGANGYILKDIEASELISTIKNTYKGLATINNDILGIYIKNVEKEKEKELSGNEAAEKINELLSEREKQVLRLLVTGKSYKDISSELFISEGSLRNAISDILKKLNLKDRVQLAVYAVKSKLV